MLKQLYQLQELETAERALAEERVTSAEFRQLRSIRASFEAQKEKYANLKAVIARLEKKLSSYHTRVTDLERRVEKEQQSIYDGSVTNAKELASREAQLAALQDKLDAAELEQRQHQERLASRQEEAAALRAALTDLQAEFAGVRDVFNQQQAVRDQAAAELKERKHELVATIDRESLDWFESQRSRFNGTPVSRLNSSCVCSGCHTMVTPASYKRTVSGASTYCENCGRLLFVED